MDYDSIINLHQCILCGIFMGISIKYWPVSSSLAAASETTLCETPKQSAEAAGSHKNFHCKIEGYLSQAREP